MIAVSERQATGWIYSPGLDLIVGCGAWSLPLLALAYSFNSGMAAGWVAAFYVLALFINYPHYMATIYRAYRAPQDFARYRAYTVYATCGLAAVLLAAHWWYALIPWLFTIYLTWSPWHYMGQNYGLLMMFAGRNQVEIDRKDRNAIRGAFVASYLMIFLTFHANGSTDPYMVSLGLPAFADLLRIPLLAVFLVLAIWPLSRLGRRFGWRPMLAPGTLCLTQFLWFVLPTVLELTFSFQLPQASYSAGVLAVLHSAQYLWITSHFARSETRTQGSPWRYAAYCGVLFLGGLALFVPGPWIASSIFGRDFAGSFLVFTAVVNIHHFILDGVVWKLRDARVRRILVSRISVEGEASFDGLADGSAPAARDARQRLPRWAKPAAAALLVALAMVDQVRHYLVLPGASTAGLVMAATLAPNDAAVQTKLGQAYGAAGDTTSMEQALLRALDINPHNAEALNSLVRGYVESGRFAEGLQLYKEISRRVELDAPALVNYGILALKDEDGALAVTVFQRAIEKSPGYAPAQLYLGDLIHSQGHDALTRAHYRRCQQDARRAGNRELETACSVRESALVQRQPPSSSRMSKNPE
jgi:pentatricopeptide repeat protein